MKTCENPILAVSLCKTSEGKHKLKFLPTTHLNYDLNSLKEKFGSDNVYLLPCGRCEACRSNYSNDWAIRCTLEAKEHKFNYFVTLTYRDPYDKYCNKTDLRRFIDRIEKYDPTVKYFACKEEGELTHRNHWHLILFCNKDLDIYDPVRIGTFYHYHSHVLDQKWQFGLHDIASFEFNCAGYVAKYTGKNSKCFMSRNLGKSYFLKHFDEIIDDGFKVYGSFKNKEYVEIPRCFVRWFDEIAPEVIANYKIDKKKYQHLMSVVYSFNNHLEYEEEIYIDKRFKEVKKKGGIRDICK